MTQLSKVVWREGMHLAQHHFQTQARYLEASLDFALTRLFTAPYGVTDLALDEATLRNGTAALTHARGVMPDGLAFDMPESDVSPPPRRIADLVSDGDGDLLLLAVPPYREGGANVAPSDGAVAASPSARFSEETRRVHDDVLGRDVQSVTVGRKNFRFVLAREASGTDLVTLPLARVRRDASGTLVIDPRYVPPCLQLGASERVVGTLRRLLELLDAKRAALSAERRPVTGVAAFGAHELSTFWLLHTINASIGPLRHLLTARQAHPERLYVELARLAGALCTFGLASDPAEIPSYDHERFGDCLDELERHVRAHLELAMPTGGVRVPLQRTASGTFEGTIVDRRVLGPSRWILGVRAALGEASLVDRVPRLVKVCSGAGITKLVQRALPGMELTFLPTAPSSIAPRADTRYFAVSTEGPCWQHVQMTSSVGIHVPAELVGAELDLVVLVDS
jgi:type VI secretion system protein ImpJ